MQRLIALFLVALTLHCPSAARAQDGEPLDESARPIFEAGRAAYGAGRYAEAAEAFERVFSMTRHPFMLWNLGNTYEKLGQRMRAAAAFRRYLVLVPDASNQIEVQAHIDELDRPMPAPVSPPVPAPPAPAPAQRGLLAGRTYTWIALGGSLALVAVGTGLWIDARSQYDVLALSCGARQGCSDAQVQSVSGRVTVTNVLLGLSVISLAGAVALWFIEAPTASSSDEHVRLDARVAQGGGLLLLQGRL